MRGALLKVVITLRLKPYSTTPLTSDSKLMNRFVIDIRPQNALFQAVFRSNRHEDFETRAPSSFRKPFATCNSTPRKLMSRGAQKYVQNRRLRIHSVTLVT